MKTTRHMRNRLVVRGGALIAILALVLSLFPSIAGAWFPPPIGRTSVRTVESTDDDPFGETHKVGPQSGLVTTPSLSFVTRILVLFLDMRQMTSRQLHMTETGTDAILTAPSDLSSRTTDSR